MSEQGRHEQDDLWSASEQSHAVPRAAADPGGRDTVEVGAYSLPVPGAGLCTVVSGAARVSGAVADAVVEVDQGEHDRRVACGLGAVDDVGVLDALMSLPLGAEVAVDDLGVVTARLLRRAPAGCVNWVDGGVRLRRLIVPACSAPLVVVRAGTWRAGLRRAAEFEPFARRVVLVTRPSKTISDYAWEADAAGTGLWIQHPNSEIEQIVPPAPFEPRFVKPARWRFTERAYLAARRAGAVSSR